MMSDQSNIKPSNQAKHTYISLEHVLRFLAYGKSLGAPVDDILAFYGIDLRRDTKKPGYVPGHIWEMIIVVGIEWCKRMGDPLSGMGAAIGLGNSFLGLWSFIAEKSDDLGKAIEIAVTYKKLHADTLDVVVRHQPGYLDIVITPTFRNAEAYANASDFYLTQLDKFVKYSTGEALGVVESVHFQHAAPQTPALLERYHAVFNCPVYFNASDNILRIHARALNLPLVSADAALQIALEPRAREQLAAFEFKDDNIESQTRYHLRTLIASGRVSKDVLAEKLGMNPRALLRKLQSAGTSYRTLYHKVRLEIAQEYLMQPVLPLAFIANHLGFQDPQSFSRWFTEQAGEAPSTYRNRYELNA